MLSGSTILIFWHIFVAPDSPETPVLEVIGSASIGNAAAGFVFGILFGYWFGSVLFRAPGSKATYPEIAVGLVMLVLLVVGLAGQRSIMQAFSRLTSLEVAGTKLGFEPSTAPPNLGPSLANTPSGSTNRASPDASAALSLVTELQAPGGKDGQIVRDGRYVHLIAKARGDSGGADPATSFNLTASDFGSTLAPLFHCMASFYVRTVDDQRLAELLAPIGSGLRRFASLPPPGPDEAVAEPAEWEKDFWAAVDAMARERPADGGRPDSIPKEYEADCSKLLQLNDKNGRLSYLSVLRTDVWKRSPYPQFIVAGILAYGHQYGAAIFSLEQAIARLPKHDQADGSHPSRIPASTLVTSIRLRGAILTYMDEWIHGVNMIQPVSVLIKHQLLNLQEFLDAFNELWRLPMFSEVNGVAYTDESKLLENKLYTRVSLSKICLPPADIKEERDWRDILFLSRSYISAKLNRIAVALDQPDYFDRLRHTASLYVRDLLRINLNCISMIGSEKAVHRRMADIYEAYARVTYANYMGTRRRQDLTSDEAKAENPRLALEAVRAAQEMIKDDAPPELTTAAMSEPLSSDPVQQSVENLKALELSIEATLTVLPQ